MPAETASQVQESREPASAGAGLRAVAVGDSPHLRLLESVARFTHHRDVDALDHSLTLSLAELAGASVVSLYKHAGKHGEQVEGIVNCALGPDGAYTVTSIDPEPGNPMHEVLRACDQDARCTLLPDGSYRMLVPILRDGQVMGGLMLDSARPMEGTRALVEGFARIYANYLGLLNESERDKLTGLYNRRTFERHMQRLLQRARQHAAGGSASDGDRERGTLWLAILDIDHFKRINDTYGHLYGDEVILLLAQQMRSSFRQDDVLFRFGGEEFVVLLDAADENAAQTALERFRQRVADHAFPQIGRVTVSIGYAGIGPHDYPATVLDRADKALYFAKNNGRNQVFNYEGLRAKGALDESVAAGSVDFF